MPKIVYGIMTFHRSHKIESPNPSKEFSSDKPNACVACHMDKSDVWIAAESENIWPSINNANEFKAKKIIQSIYKLHSGDPVERGIAASNISYQSQLISNNDKKFLVPHLIFAMEDNYPAIRRFSFKSLRAIVNSLSVESIEFNQINNSLSTFDFIADNENRATKLSEIWKGYNEIDKSSWQPPPLGSLLNNEYKLDRQTLMQLKKISKQESKQIQIGE